MALCLLSKQILLTEMAIIIHGSSAGVQDKHFIRLLPPNKMTLHRRGPCLDMWIMHAVCLRTEAGGGNTALIVLLKTSWRLKCRIMVFIVKNKVWVVTGQRVCSKVTEHKKKKKNNIQGSHMSSELRHAPLQAGAALRLYLCLKPSMMVALQPPFSRSLDLVVWWGLIPQLTYYCWTGLWLRQKNKQRKGLACCRLVLMQSNCQGDQSQSQQIRTN